MHTRTPLRERQREIYGAPHYDSTSRKGVTSRVWICRTARQVRSTWRSPRSLGLIKIADEEALPVVPGPSGFSLFEFLFGAPRLNVEVALAKRFPNQAKALRRYFRIADAVRGLFSRSLILLTPTGIFDHQHSNTNAREF